MKPFRLSIPVPQFVADLILAMRNGVNWFLDSTIAIVATFSASAGALTTLGFVTNTGIGVFILAICILPAVLCADISKRTDVYYSYEIERIQRKTILVPSLAMLWFSSLLLIWAARFGPTP